MRVIQAANVNDAYAEGMRLLDEQGSREQSRNGEVIALPYPVATVYSCPAERVLFDARRDANPFFHLFEAVWMIAGRRDGRWLDTYVRDFSSRFAEEDGDVHGAYGHRWRQHFWSGETGPETTADVQMLDQLLVAGSMLYDDPTTRRAVVQMWDPTVDLGASKRDVPCNISVMLRARPEAEWELDATVCCRSNDAIWGAYGANAVHMSFLAEVLAGLAGMHLGHYTQISNNLHAYTSVFEKVWSPSRGTQVDPYFRRQVEAVPLLGPRPPTESWTREDARHRALNFVHDCELFCHRRKATDGPMSCEDYFSWWFTQVAVPMENVHRLWRSGERDEAMAGAQHVAASDWRRAAQDWMHRRMGARR